MKIPNPNLALIALSTLFGSIAAAQPLTCTGGAIPAGAGEDIEITGACTAGAGTYKFGYVNIFKGGSLTFADAKIDFWAKGILVEKDSKLAAGTPAAPIGAAGGVLTIHLYGAKGGMHATGITCKTDERCGVPENLWTTNPASKANLPGGVYDFFYAYEAGKCGSGIFGDKSLGISYGATLALYGAHGSKFGPISALDSGNSWTRLDATVTGGNTVRVDRVVDWKKGDQIVVTTTDYLPGHSEQLTVDTLTYGDHSTTITTLESMKYPHNGQVFDLTNLPPGIGPDSHDGSVPEHAAWGETRAAVALLTRSIRIVSAGDKLDEAFPAESTHYYYGGHTFIRQGFQSVQIQGVEFYQMGQGGDIGRYPIHFHLARRVPTDTLLADNSIHDSMTRWVTLHGTQGVTLSRNVGYKSIGHGFYLEDGTEIDNKFYSNIGIFARAAVDNVQNPRKVPGILAEPFPNYTQPQENVPFHSDVDHPTVFWITNGYNDFFHNMAAGAGTCGVCYWLLPTSISGLSKAQKWEGYAGMESNTSRAAMTPLYRFEGNGCSSAMNAFNTIGNTTECFGLTNQAPGANAPVLKAIPNPNPIDHSMYPEVDPGGGRFPTRCPEGADCSTIPKCGSGATENCMVTVLDRFTTSFNWAETNFSSVWLRPQWYLFLNSVVTDVQNGGLTFVTGGGYTKSDLVDGHWALAKQSAFIGHAQNPADNPYAANSGPVNPKTPLQCAKQTGTGGLVGNFCLLPDEGVSFPMSNFGNNQRLFNIYDGPAYQESNAYLNITRTTLEDCTPQSGGGLCAQSKYMQGRMPAVPKSANGTCYLPNAAIAWKQPNGFYYPPAFHSQNLFFQDVEIRHYVIQPLFSSTGRYQTDPVETAKRYCTWVPGMFTGFTDIDRQTELSDNDGSLTGLVNTVSVNQDPYFSAPVATAQCASDVAENTPPGTATTSPYDYVTTVVYPGCGLGCTNWNRECTSPACHGVPLYRQYQTASETEHTFIRMAGQSTAQRSTLTVNNGKYYMDTTLSAAQQQQAGASALNVFQAGETYYTFTLFAKPTTKQTYQMYVGPGFDVSTGVFMARADISGIPVKFNKGSWPTTWPAPVYDAGTGLLTVTMDMSFPDFQTQYTAAIRPKCKPATFCSWNAASNSCGSALSQSDPLFPESQSICAKWPVKDIDCPEGGCYAVGVTMPVGFTTGTKEGLPPQPTPFPNSPEWTSPFVTAPLAVAGQQCYYPSPPVK